MALTAKPILLMPRTVEAFAPYILDAEAVMDQTLLQRPSSIDPAPLAEVCDPRIVRVDEDDKTRTLCCSEALGVLLSRAA